MHLQGSDKIITQQINRHLVDHGVTWPSKVAVETRSGEVTLTGSVQYFHQKKAAVAVTVGITGVRRVTDELTIDSRTRSNFLPPLRCVVGNAAVLEEYNNRRLPDKKVERPLLDSSATSNGQAR